MFSTCTFNNLSQEKRQAFCQGDIFDKRGTLWSKCLIISARIPLDCYRQFHYTFMTRLCEQVYSYCLIPSGSCILYNKQRSLIWEHMIYVLFYQDSEHCKVLFFMSTVNNIIPVLQTWILLHIHEIALQNSDQYFQQLHYKKGIGASDCACLCPLTSCHYSFFAGCF